MSDERKSHAVEPKNIQKDHIMAMLYYVKVKDVPKTGEHMVVEDLDTGIKGISVQGKELLAKCFSADLYEEEEKVTMTKAAEILVNSHNRPFTVCFEKSDHTERVLRGRLVKPEPLLGRSMVEDLDKSGKDRLRQVDHRTIKFIVVDGVRYTVK